MTPVLELCQKLRQKIFLSREEVVTVTSVLGHQFAAEAGKSKVVWADSLEEDKKIHESAERLGDYLTLAYIVMVNTHSFDASDNYLGMHR